MDERIFASLNEAQASAVKAVRGPVAILAGAGTGKTTTITHRIAWQVASGTVASDAVLAVTFTDRAANEMRERLAALGVQRVRARTFHAEALAQVAHFSSAPELLPSKAQILGPLVRRLPAPYKFRATKDVAGEIEWAKNRRITPARYADAIGDRATPIPPDLMSGLYGEYEARKRRGGRMDFEDLLEQAIRLNGERADVAETIAARYRAFTVDEYQDVNLLQQALLDCWLQGRDEVCVVGDDYQSIFGFTGASPSYLLEFPKRYPGARVVTLEENHRSTPQVLEVANRLVPELRGTAKVLRPTRAAGPDVWIGQHPSGDDETEAIVERIRTLHQHDVPFEEMAVLYRVNARSEDYEEALSRASVPFQVRDGAFLRRPGPRAVLARLRRVDQRAPAVREVAAAAKHAGFDPDVEAEGEEEITRQADMGRLVRLAAELVAARPDATVGDFVADLTKRFEGEGRARGVVLSTYHRAKGLEFEAVFLPRLEERELPFALAKGEDEVAEERRLLYVGITRAKRHLSVSWSAFRDGKSARPSRFVSELVPRLQATTVRPAERVVADDPALFGRLREWRARTAREANVPAYVVFHDATLRAISDARPASLIELGRIAGIGPTKLARYGSGVLEVVRSSSS